MTSNDWVAIVLVVVLVAAGIVMLWTSVAPPVGGDEDNWEDKQ